MASLFDAGYILSGTGIDPDHFALFNEQRHSDYRPRLSAALIADERDALANSANFVGLLFAAMPDINWAGIYVRREEELVLGPFQGLPAQLISRFERDQEKRRRNEAAVHQIDDDFVDALRAGLPQCAGVAIGFDRLLMLHEDQSDISAVSNFVI